MELNGKTAVVTGASRGIGRAVAIELARLGAYVVVNYAGNKEAASQTVESCVAVGGQAVAIQGDISQAEACTQLIETAIKTTGRIDILVNNAGIIRDNLLMRMSEEDFDQVVDTNLKGTYLCMKAAIRPMIKQKYGRIISLSSVVGIVGNAGQVNYSASKAGIIGMTKSLAREVARKNITVNAVAPGFIATDMSAKIPEAMQAEMLKSIPAGTLGQPEDIAHAVAFLASDEARYITGQVLQVDGGMAM